MDLDDYSLDVMIDFINIDKSVNAIEDFNFFFKNLIKDDIDILTDWAKLIHTDYVARRVLNNFLDLYRDGILAVPDSYYHLIYDVFDMVADGLLEPDIFDEFFQKLEIPELRALFHHFATHSELYAKHLLKYISPGKLLRAGEEDYPDYLANVTDLSDYFEDPEFVTRNKVLLNIAYHQMLEKLVQQPFNAKPFEILLNRSFDYYNNTEMLVFVYRIYKNFFTGRIEIPEYGNNIESWVDYTDRIFGPFLAGGSSRDEIYRDITLQFALRQAKHELDTVEQAQKAVNQEIFEDVSDQVKEYLQKQNNTVAKQYIDRAVEDILEYTESQQNINVLSPSKLNEKWYFMLAEALQDIKSDDLDLMGAITSEQLDECLKILYPPDKTLTQIVMDAFIAQDVTLREKLAFRNLSRYRGEPDPELEEFPLKN